MAPILPDSADTGRTRCEASGGLADRPQLTACLDYVRDGDTIVVWRLDRLGRSLPHLIETVWALADRGVGFKSVQEAIDTTTPGSRLVFHAKDLYDAGGTTVVNVVLPAGGAELHPLQAPEGRRLKPCSPHGNPQSPKASPRHPRRAP